MTSIVKLTALSGVMDESPPCYLLQVDDFRILLDCGWDEMFSSTAIDNVRPYVDNLDAILLTYPDAYHLGMLPYLVGKCELDCPIYATVPVYKMGQMFIYDLHQSHSNCELFDLFSLDDVDAAFEKITQVKYQQPVLLHGRGQGLSLTAYNAGHMVGGTIWKITKDGEEDIVYAVDFNHKRERHLNGCAMEAMTRAHILITDAFNGLYTQEHRRKHDENLMMNIMNTLKDRGNVLICIDSAGRLLEIAQMLDQLWGLKDPSMNEDSPLSRYPLAILNNVSYNVIEFAKSQMEWMSDKIMTTFETERTNPFAFKHTIICHNLNDLKKLGDPKVVLASQPDLECGYARDLFVQYCSNPRNTVIFTQRTCPGTLTRFLIENPDTKTLNIPIKKKVPLEGEERDLYFQELKVQTSVNTSHENVEADVGIDDVDMESSDSEIEDNTDKKAELPGSKHDYFTDIDANKLSVFRPTKKSFPMFPCKTETLVYDDYGEIINVAELINIEPAHSTEVEKKVVRAPVIESLDENPTKCIVKMTKLEVRCKHIFIDFEGRSDGDSIKKIIAYCKPRQLILVHGSPGATHFIANHCRSPEIVQHEVFTPNLLETIDATLESFIYQVKLPDNLITDLEWKKAKDFEITWVDGIVDQEKKEINFEQSHKIDNVPVLDKPHPSIAKMGHPSVYINEVKLNEFKQLLTKSGIEAEFVRGVLFCNEKVAIKREASGKITIEGLLSEDYYIVRDLLYQQFAVV